MSALDEIGDDLAEARAAWLLTLPPDRIARFDTETILDWLDARREQRIAQLRAACQELRAASAQQQRAYANIRAALLAAGRRP